jgi:hypothetical protein
MSATPPQEWTTRGIGRPSLWQTVGILQWRLKSNLLAQGAFAVYVGGGDEVCWRCQRGCESSYKRGRIDRGVAVANWKMWADIASLINFLVADGPMPCMSIVKLHSKEKITRRLNFLLIIIHRRMDHTAHFLYGIHYYIRWENIAFEIVNNYTK